MAFWSHKLQKFKMVADWMKNVTFVGLNCIFMNNLLIFWKLNLFIYWNFRSYHCKVDIFEVDFHEFNKYKIKIFT